MGVIEKMICGVNIDELEGFVCRKMSRFHISDRGKSHNEELHIIK